MVLIAAIAKRDQKPGIRNCFHLRENPLREERSGGPPIAPARRMNGRIDSLCPRSGSIFTMRARGIPDLRKPQINRLTGT